MLAIRALTFNEHSHFTIALVVVIQSARFSIKFAMYVCILIDDVNSSI